jgi:AcrR family transcriptional regulator
MTARSNVRKLPAPSRPRVRRGNVEDAAQLRRELREAAMTLFREGGLAAVTMRALASRVGMSAMSSYRYFPDKSAVLSELWQGVLAELRTAMSHAIGQATGPRDRLHAGLESFLRYYETHPDHFWLAYETQDARHVTERPGPQQAAVYGELQKLVRGLIEDWAHDLGAGATYIEDAEKLSFMMQLGYLQASMVNRRYPWGDLQRLRAATVEQILQTVTRCVLHGPLPTDPLLARPSPQADK